MEEQFVPGDYTALGVINIRLQMKTMPETNKVGGYMQGTSFRVYQVYSEANGILWGRVSSATGEGQARYVALRVNNNVKAKLEKAFEEDTSDSPLEKGFTELTDAITLLTVAVRELARNK